MSAYRFRELAGRKVLIVGEVGSGKTALTAKLLQQAVAMGFRKKITVLDMAPRIYRSHMLKVGGRIADYFSPPMDMRYLSSDRIRAPRLEGKSADDVWKIAKRNAVFTSDYLRRYLEDPTSLLFINDLTIHLHAGSAQLLEDSIRKSSTFIGNGYMGFSLAPDHGSGLSSEEKKLLQKFTVLVDLVLRLPTKKSRYR